MIVVAIIGIAGVLLAARTGTFSYWSEEAFIRHLAETIQLLHEQAMQDGEYYRLEFSFKPAGFRAGIMKVEEDDASQELIELSTDAGALSLELAAFLNPSPGRVQTLIPPPSFPSLAEPVFAPEGVEFTDIVNMSGKHVPARDGNAAMMFSPRGFSEFAVIHLSLSSKAPVTLLVNPFTGLVDVFREYKEYEWTYGRQQKG